VVKTLVLIAALTAMAGAGGLVRVMLMKGYENRVKRTLMKSAT